MHDWTLLTISFEWGAATATLAFRGPRSQLASIVADGVSDLNVPQSNDWGHSVSVNEVRGPAEIGGSRRRLEIEMQSGDVITIIATAFVLPRIAVDGSVLLTTTAGEE